jgi:hypothetical protein
MRLSWRRLTHAREEQCRQGVRITLLIRIIEREKLHVVLHFVGFNKQGCGQPLEKALDSFIPWLDSRIQSRRTVFLCYTHLPGRAHTDHEVLHPVHARISRPGRPGRQGIALG